MAHLAVAEAAVTQCRLARIDLVVSVRSLGKEDLSRPRLADRLAVLDDVAATRPWLSVRVTEAQLIVDVAAGYDVVVVGADKWAQVVDPVWYEGSTAARDEALARLPFVAVAPRPPSPAPTDRMVLDVPVALQAVSSTAVRTGASAWMTPEAARFAARTGAWVDEARYDAWLAGQEREGSEGHDPGPRP